MKKNNCLACEGVKMVNHTHNTKKKDLKLVYKLSSLVLIMLGSFMLGMSYIKFVNVGELTTAYNRGFISGRYQVLTELYECEEIDNQYITDNYLRMYKIANEQGIETYYNCVVEN